MAEFTSLYRELLASLTPHMLTMTDRQAILTQALLGDLMYRIDLHGAADVFTANLVNVLLRQGERTADPPAIIAVLDVVYRRVGYDKQQVLADLRCRLQTYLASSQPIPWPTPEIWRWDRLLEATMARVVTFFSLAGIPPHLNTSWAGRFIFLMRKHTAGITAERVWTLVVWFTLWVATNWLITPILDLPLDDLHIRGQAALLYTIATLVLPFIVAVITPADRQDEIDLTQRAVWLRFWYLKLVGACTGYALVAGAVLTTIFLYYIGLHLPRSLQWFLLLMPLLFSYVGARRGPGDRLQMYGSVRLHEVDRLVIGVWLLLGPGTAAAIYLGYPVLSQPGLGLLVLIALSATLLWERQKAPNNRVERTSNGVSDFVRIALFGLLFPLLFLFLIFGFTLPSALPSATDWQILGVVTPYFAGSSLLVATIFVRNPPTLTIRGMVSVLVVLWSIALLLYLNPHTPTRRN